MPKILFVTDQGERHQRSALKAAPSGHEVIVRRRPSEADLLPLMPTVDFLITERNQPVTAALIEASPALKLIVRLGSLTYDIDREAARARGIHVSVQPVVRSVYTAEHVLLLMLTLVKRLKRSLAAGAAAEHGLPARRTDENTFAFNWLNYTDIGGLYGKTVAILGMGEIGVELARRLKPMRLQTLLYYKRTRYPTAVEREFWLSYVPMLDCVKRADVLVSLLPITAETDRSIHGGTLKMMKPSAFLVHAGSGSVIDEQALGDALRAGKLAGAALDTYEYEPLQPTHSLVALARSPEINLLLTPHVAGASVSTDRSDDFAEIVRYLANEPLKFELP